MHQPAMREGRRGVREDEGEEREDQARRQRGRVSTAAGDNIDQLSSKGATVKCIIYSANVGGNFVF